MRRTSACLLVALVAASPALAANGAHRSLSADTEAARVTIKRDAKAFGFAVKHAAISIGHGAKRFGLKVASATKQGVHDYRAHAAAGKARPKKP